MQKSINDDSHNNGDDDGDGDGFWYSDKIVCFQGSLELNGVWLIEEQIGAICCDGNAAALPRRRKKISAGKTALKKNKN